MAEELKKIVIELPIRLAKEMELKATDGKNLNDVLVSYLILGLESERRGQNEK